MNIKLPFSLNESDFLEWFNQLDKKDHETALALITSTLKGIAQQTIPLKLRAFFLHQLLHLTIRICQAIQSNLIGQSFPFDKQIQIELNLAIHCSEALVNGHILVCEDSLFNTDKVFSKTQKAGIIVNAMLALEKIQYSKALLYQKTTRGFWSRCFLFFLFAKKNHSIEQLVGKTNFIHCFKYLIIFELSNPCQFSSEEILIIFSLLKQHAYLVELSCQVPDKKFGHIRFIDLRKDTPPSFLKQQEPIEQPYILYIINFKLIKYLHKLLSENKTFLGRRKATLLRLIKTLTMNQQRQHERHSVQGNICSIVGFDAIRDYLRVKQASDSQEKTIPGVIQDLDFDILPGRRDYSDTDEFRDELQANLSLVDEPEAMERISNEDIWSNTENIEKTDLTEKEPETMATDTELVDKSDSGFMIALKIQETAVIVGDIIALVMDESFIVTIVRRIVSTKNNKLQIGVEILGYMPQLLTIINVDKRDITGLYLTTRDQKDSIIVKIDEFQEEGYIFADQDQKILKFRVEKQCHVSPVIRQMEVTPS